MKNLIIITGDLAAGKSTLAASLANELKIPFITKDTLKEIACDAIGYSSREENRHLSIAATSAMVYFFQQMALANNDLILEANFREDELYKIKQIAEENTYRVALIVLTGDINLLYQRFLDRLSNRHIAHCSLNLDYSLERFEEYINSIRNQNLLFPPHYIDMSDLDEEDVASQALEIINIELGL